MLNGSKSFITHAGVGEIFIVAALLYRLLLLIQRTRAMQMLLGVFLLAFIYVVSWVMDLTLIRYLMETLFQYGVIAALVVFQPELRSALARLGQSRMLRIFQRMEESQVVEEIVEDYRAYAVGNSHRHLPEMRG